MSWINIAISLSGEVVVRVLADRFDSDGERAMRNLGRCEILGKKSPLTLRTPGGNIQTA